LIEEILPVGLWTVGCKCTKSNVGFCTFSNAFVGCKFTFLSGLQWKQNV
jgi:hypothetical protein